MFNWADFYMGLFSTTAHMTLAMLREQQKIIDMYLGVISPPSPIVPTSAKPKKKSAKRKSS